MNDAARLARARPAWVRMTDDELLSLRFCDLGLQIAGTPLEERIARLRAELRDRGLRFRPHAWLSSEWFSPDGVPGIAIPFYLAHPRLMRLEESQVYEVEGGTPRWCMQLMRHEAAHALDSAYFLHRKKSWRDTFGAYSEPYAKFYKPKPYSKSYVLHLDLWYAQSHPAEDWAETFAVWLDPSSRWKKRYQGWPALRKLEYVDRLMSELSGSEPRIKSREQVEPLSKLTTSLRDHYAAKKKRYGLDHPRFYDRDLHRLFRKPEEGVRGRSAAAFLRKQRRDLRRVVARWTGEYQYTIDQVLAEMIERCEEHDLRHTMDDESTKRNAVVLLTVLTMNFLHGGHHRLAR